MTHYTRLEELFGNSLQRVSSFEGSLRRGVIPSFDRACSSMDCCTLSSAQGSHSLMSTRTCMIPHDTHVTINYQKFLYSYSKYHYMIYRCLLHIANTYICRYYLHTNVNQTKIPDEILDDDAFEEMAIWSYEKIKQEEELNEILSDIQSEGAA